MYREITANSEVSAKHLNILWKNSRVLRVKPGVTISNYEVLSG